MIETIVGAGVIIAILCVLVNTAVSASGSSKVETSQEQKAVSEFVVWSATILALLLGGGILLAFFQAFTKR